MTTSIFSRNTLDVLKSRVSDGIYSLPWCGLRIEYCWDPKRVADYASKRFTRSRFVMKMLTEFHLSRNSIVVSDDNHVSWLKPMFQAHLPADEAIPQLARDVIVRALPPPVDGQNERTLQISSPLIRELYVTALDKVLNVTVLKPLDDYIRQTEFPQGKRTMLLEGLMYSLRLHSLLLRPVCLLLDGLFFRETRHMKKIAQKLEQMVCDFTIPRPGSWLSVLMDLKKEGKLTRAQVRGEITSMLVSSFSLAAALSSALLCLAARPRYRRKIHDDPAFARYFVMEVLRLYPPFRQFGYERLARRSGKEPASGDAQEFMVSVFALHRNQDAWTDPKKFHPERFLEPDAAKGYKYLPFGMGKRICSGRMFSMSMITEAVKYVCSDECPIIFQNLEKLPKGRSGRLVSFAMDDTLTYRAR